MVQPAIRSNFADTAPLGGALSTDKDGTAQVALDMPENLTTWRIKVWAMGQGTKVGEGSTDVVTRKDLIIRMQAPRFFVQTDEVVLSANVHNYLKSKKTVKVVLDVDGKLLEPLAALQQSVDGAGQRRGPGGLAGEGARRGPGHDPHEGPDRRRVGRHGAEVPLLHPRDAEDGGLVGGHPAGGQVGPVHGPRAGPAAAAGEPAGGPLLADPGRGDGRRPALPGQLSLRLHRADAQPLPAHGDHAESAVEDGAQPGEIKRKRTNLNAQELGRPASGGAVEALRPQPGVRRGGGPADGQGGLQRLGEMQLSDGGWGWFSGFGESSSPHTTAYVVHGLQIARYNDVALVPGMLERGVGWLVNYQDQQVLRLKNAEEKPKKEPWKESADDLDALVYMVLGNENLKNAQMMDFLYRDRTHLSVYSLAMYGIALDRQNEKEKLAMILRNIGQYLVMDDEDQTAYLKLPNEGYWWCWYGSEYEAHAYYLKLLARTDPKGEVARRLVKYLLNNRKHASYWNSTRDTAVVVEAMADFLRASGEDRPEMTRRGLARRPAGKGRGSDAGHPLPVRQPFRPGGPASDRRPRTRSSSARRAGAALLQRLPDQLHPGRPDRQGRAGDQGPAEVLPAQGGPEVDRRGRLAGPGGPAEGGEIQREELADWRRSAAASWWRSSWRSRARTTTSTWSSRT